MNTQNIFWNVARKVRLHTWLSEILTEFPQNSANLLIVFDTVDYFVEIW